MTEIPAAQGVFLAVATVLNAVGRKRQRADSKFRPQAFGHRHPPAHHFPNLLANSGESSSPYAPCQRVPESRLDANCWQGIIFPQKLSAASRDRHFNLRIRGRLHSQNRQFLRREGAACLCRRPFIGQIRQRDDYAVNRVRFA